jgi:hypothetical protein
MTGAAAGVRSSLASAPRNDRSGLASAGPRRPHRPPVRGRNLTRPTGPGQSNMRSSACIFMHRSPALRMPSHAADRGFRIAIALAPPSAAHAARGCVIQTAKLIAGHGAMGEWREPGQDDPDAADVLDLDPGLEDGTSPGSSSGPDPGRRACPGTPQRNWPPRPRARWDAAALSVRHPYSGITLSDGGGPGERTRILPADMGGPADSGARRP